MSVIVRKAPAFEVKETKKRCRGWQERASFSAILSGECTWVIPPKKEKEKMSCPSIREFFMFNQNDIEIMHQMRSQRHA